MPLHSYEGLVSQAAFRVCIVYVASSENVKSIIVKAVVSTAQMWTDKLPGTLLVQLLHRCGQTSSQGTLLVPLLLSGCCSHFICLVEGLS